MCAGAVPRGQGWLGKRNRCFLGDAGSTLLGYLLGWALIRYSQSGHTGLSPVGTLWCVALPVMDVFAVMTRRTLAHRNPFKPDRGHIHHLLLNAGLSHRQTLLALTLLAAAMWLFGNTVNWLHLGSGSNLVAFCLIATLYVATTDHVWHRQLAAGLVKAPATIPPAIVAPPRDDGGQPAVSPGAADGGALEGYGMEAHPADRREPPMTRGG